MKRILDITFILVLMLSASVAFAQNSEALGTYTPYSMFGLGTLNTQGGAYNAGMGGIGVGIRDKRFINYLNPASITERDTLSFMLDFGTVQKNLYYSDGSRKSAYNSFNMHNIVLTTPIYRNSALIIGLIPFSDIGYSFERVETDPDVIVETGDVKYKQYGKGSISQLFVGAAVDFLKDFSFGAQLVYYFGSLDRYSTVEFGTDASFNSIISNRNYYVGALTGNFGLQYSKDIKKTHNITVGVAYKMGTNLKGYYTGQAFANSETSADTLYYNSRYAKLYVPDEYSAGISFSKKDVWRVGFDYVAQNWSGVTFPQTPGVDFSTRLSQSFKAGFEITPNRYDIRYYMKRCTYRVGAYYDMTYMKIGNRGIDAAGITFGMSLPVYRWYNAVNFSIDVGQRGSLKMDQLRENYVIFKINIALHDIWFRKPKFD